MDIEFLIGTDGIQEQDIIFDSRDYVGTETGLDDIVEDIEDAFQDLFRHEKGNAIFMLLSAPAGCSIVDIFQKIVEAGQRNAIQILKVCVSSHNVADYLKDKIPPLKALTYKIHFEDKTLSICTGDITEIMADAIINASNTRLVLGGGVSGAIHRKAGPVLQMEMSRIASSHSLHPGDVVITGSFELKTCSRILHAATVDGSYETVSKAVKNCLILCDTNRIKSVAFPALGTGTGGLDLKKCAEITWDAIFDFWQRKPKTGLNTVIIVLRTKKAFDLFSDYAEYKVSIL